MLWHQCLQHLEQELTDQEINTWLRTLHGTDHKNTLFLLAPNDFVLKHVHAHYLEKIINCVRSITADDETQVTLQIGSSAADIKEDIPEPSNITEKEVVSGSANLTKIERSFTNSLSQTMTFENFVEGKSNQLARASALQVTENLGDSYNPLFIYGGSGLGKTHLLHAIGNRILEENKNAHVVYLTSESFVNDLVRALRNNQINEFKTFYRSADALLIDDIQFFAGKTRSMEEFFHTFNTLQEGQKQILLTSDKYPRNVKGIDDRLLTRFNWGLSVSVDPPDLETRVAILRKKAETFSLKMPNDVAFFIAKHFNTNVRDLEGALQKIIATLRFSKVNKLTLDFAHETLRDQLASQTQLISMENIKQTVAHHYNIRVSDLNSASRIRDIARPRQIAMSLSKKLTNHSYPEIGKNFGGRDHTTVIHACKTVDKLLYSDPDIKKGYNILHKILTTS